MGGATLRKFAGFTIFFASMTLVLFFQNCGKDINSQFEAAEQSSFSESPKPEFELNQPLPIPFQSFGVDISNSSSVFAADIYESVYYSSNSGQSWKVFCTIPELKDASNVTFKVVQGQSRAYLQVNSSLYHIEEVNQMGCRRIESSERFSSLNFDINSRGDLFIWGEKGLRVSTDRGANFTKLVPTRSRSLTLTVDPKNEASVISFHRNSGDDQSMAGGLYYGDRRIDFASPDMANSLSYNSPLFAHPKNPLILFLGNYYSLDGGESWRPKPDFTTLSQEGIAYSLRTDSATSKLLVHSSANILDNNPTWVKETGQNLTVARTGNSTLFASSNIRYVLSGNIFYFSSDNGESYKIISYSTRRLPMIASLIRCFEKTCYAFAKGDYLLRTVDGRTWSLFRDLRGTYFGSVTFHPNLANRFFLLPSNNSSNLVSAQYYLDENNLFKSTAQAPTTNYTFVTFDPSDSENVYILSRDKIYFKNSTDPEYSVIPLDRQLLGNPSSRDKTFFQKNADGRWLFYTASGVLYKINLDTKQNENISARLPFSSSAGIAQTSIGGKAVALIISPTGSVVQVEDGRTFVSRSSTSSLPHSNTRELLVWPGQSELMITYTPDSPSFFYSANAGLNWTSVLVHRNCRISSLGWIEKRTALLGCGSYHSVTKISF